MVYSCSDCPRNCQILRNERDPFGFCWRRLNEYETRLQESIRKDINAINAIANQILDTVNSESMMSVLIGVSTVAENINQLIETTPVINKNANEIIKMVPLEKMLTSSKLSI